MKLLHLDFNGKNFLKKKVTFNVVNGTYWLKDVRRLAKTLTFHEFDFANIGIFRWNVRKLIETQIL